MASKVISEGRIVVWQGASLWAFDVLSERESRENRMHAHHAFQVTMAAGGIANVGTGEGLVKGPLVLVAPNVPHAIEPEGRIAILFVEPESRAGGAFRRLLGDDPIVRRDAMPGVDRILTGLWSDPRPTDAEIASIGTMVLEQFVGSDPADPVRDPRITRVLDWLVAQQGESDVTAADAAGVACLSESRFSHVFV